MPISKGLIPNSMLCLIPKVLLQCPVNAAVSKAVKATAVGWTAVAFKGAGIL